MEYTSFYGGRRGASFVIVKSYRCIQEPDPSDENFNNIIRIDLGYQDMEKEISSADRTKWLEEHCMVHCFSKGGDYKTVNYDEYVIIDALDRNDIDNGKIYRRGYDYNNEVGGAEYIGQVVGPTGPAPQVEMKTYKEVQDEYGDRGPIDPETGDEYRKSEGAYAPTENLIPGQYYDEGGTEKFNDEIKWITCSIRDAHSHQSTVHVGFIFPYKVTQWTANSVSPYYHRSDAENQDMDNWDETGDTTTFYNDKLVTRVDDLSHPFFERWDFKVPKGIKGDTFQNFRVTTVAECNEQYPGWLQQYAGMDDDKVTEAIKKERKILVYDYYHYDRDKGGDPVSIYLGDYNEITNVDLAENGTLTIDYSHNDEDVWDRVFKWITSVELNTETGHFAIKFNHDTDVKGKPTIYETDLRWVKDIEFQDNGSVNLKYTTNTDPGLEYDRLIKWIKNVELNGETGHLTVTFNYDKTPDGQPTIYETDLRWVNNIEVANDGTVTLKYTTGQDVVLDNKIKWITKTTLDPDGTLTITYNDDSTDIFDKTIQWIESIEFTDEGHLTINYNNGTPSLEKDIIWPIDFEIQTGETEGEGNQKIKITFNNGTEKEIGYPINYIMETTIDDRYHLLVLYADPAKREEIQNEEKNASWNDRDDWYDLGYIGNGTGAGAVAGKIDDEGVVAVANEMPPYSVWLIVED